MDQIRKRQVNYQLRLYKFVLDLDKLVHSKRGLHKDDDGQNSGQNRGLFDPCKIQRRDQLNV